MRPDQRNILIASALILTLVTFLVSLGLGQYPIPLDRTLEILGNLFSGPETVAQKILLKVRLPRLTACVLVGGGLAVSGAVYQGLFKNPLVSQNILGVSAGAGLGAAVAIALGLSGIFIQLAAFTGGMAAVAIVMAIAALIPHRSSLVLILAGIIVGGFSASMLTLIQYLVDPNSTLANIVYWLMGSLANTGSQDVAMVWIPMAAGLAFLFALRYRINVLSLGDDQARSLGVNVKGVRLVCILWATILTSSAVCISGTIGWFGLVVPHLARLMVGDNHQKLVPMTFFTGATAMMLVDDFARTATTTEIPLGVITGIIGAPVFTFLLLKKNMGDA